MDPKVGQAVCYLTDQGTESWALLETVLTTQVIADTFLCRELLTPLDLVKRWAGLEPGRYTGKSEVFVSSKEVRIGRRQVVRVQTLSDLRTYSKVREGLVWRRSVKSDTGALEPPFLYPICTCREPLNPDLPYVCCDRCESLFHERCLQGSECPQCKVPLLGLKRAAESAEDPPTLKHSKSESDSLVLERKPSHILQVSKYPLLTASAANDLATVLARLSEESQHLQSSLSEEDKVRQNLKDKVLGALLLSQAEMKAQGDLSTWEMKDLLAIAIEAEAALYFSSQQSVKSANYGRRARMIIFNLLDEKNSDLRANLLRNSVNPKSLAFMESKDMASSSMKQLREERERKYLEEQLICPTQGAKLIVKTHKGEGIIEMGDAIRVENSDTTDLLANLRDSRKEPPIVPEEEDDPFDPDNHDLLPQRDSPSEVKTADVTPPVRSPYIQPRIYDLVRENTPEALSQKIRKRMAQYLKPEQVEAILQAANLH